MFYVVLLISKFVNLLIGLFGYGAGYTWPGHIALKVYPGILRVLEKKFPGGVVFISGTNGKTTTTKLVTHILESSGIKLSNNRTGANLKNGIVSSFLVDSGFFEERDGMVGVFEVDELALPDMLKFVTPKILVLLNLSRDQLDRYGEVDLIIEKWFKAVEGLDTSCSLVLDSEQTRFNSLADAFNGRVFYFDSDHEYLNYTSLHGDFNAKNVNAAMLVSALFGVAEKEALESLANFEAAYGRGELLEFNNKLYKIFLAKNPASFNTNLATVHTEGLEFDTLLFVLNDEVRDGRDVSWIYDVHPENLNKVCAGKTIFVSGSRSLDMAVRLQYAGVSVPETHIHNDLSVVLSRVSANASSKDLIAFPNYSAMLELRKNLIGREIL